MWNSALGFGIALGLLGAPAAGCATADGDSDDSQSSEIAAAPAAAFVLSINGVEEERVVGGGLDTLCDGACSFAFLGGASVTITAIPNAADCLMWVSWTGACLGQGATCTLVMNSDLATTSRWGHINGCRPK